MPKASLFKFISLHRKDPMRAERKQSKILNATLQHGNDMEAWSRQLKFMQCAYTLEVDLTLKEKQGLFSLLYSNVVFFIS